MPAKMASFCFCQSARRRRAISSVLGAAQAERGRHAAGGSKATMKSCTMVRRSSSRGRNDQALVSIRMSERTSSGRCQRHGHDDPAPHGVPEEVDRAATHRLDEGGQVGGQLVDGVALERARLGRAAVAPLVERSTTCRRAARRRPQREVVEEPV